MPKELTISGGDRHLTANVGRNKGQTVNSSFGGITMGRLPEGGI